MDLQSFRQPFAIRLFAALPGLLLCFRQTALSIRHPCVYSAHCTKQDIFRSMLHIDKLQHLGIIAIFFQQIGSQGICKQCRKPLFDQTIFQRALQRLTCDLLIDLMLTAGHG